jgi:hypothetical protein
VKSEVRSEETNPIFPPGVARGLRKVGATMRNKAKLGRVGVSGGQRDGKARCAKQSQFFDCGLDTGLQRDAPYAPPGRGPVVQTNPIRQGRSCETKPFDGVECAKRTQFATATQGPAGLIVRNKANLLRGRGRPSPRPPALTMPPAGRLRGLVVQNKPNFGEV